MKKDELIATLERVAKEKEDDHNEHRKKILEGLREQKIKYGRLVNPEDELFI